MKKTYEKPQIYMERFELAEHIAGCSLEWNNADEGVCNLQGNTTGGWVNLFTIGLTESESPCTTRGDSYCYTNGAFNIATINS